MKKISAFCTAHSVRCIWWIGLVVTVAVTVMRVLMAPLSRDPDTGRFTVNMAVIAVALIATAVMALLAALGDKRRVDLDVRSARPLAVATLAAGVLVGANALYDLATWYLIGRVPPPKTAMVSAVPIVLMTITGVFAILAGVVFVLFSRQLFKKRSTWAGMCSWELLIPVLWLWFRLTRYLMSYASAVSLDECVYDFGMFVAELLFVFKFARFMSGVGRTTVAGMMAYAMSAVVWSLSAPLSRGCMYLLGDTQAYLASLAGLSDFGVGLLALAFAGGLWYAAYHGSVEESPAPTAEESAAVVVDAETESSVEEVEDESSDELSAEEVLPELIPDTTEE